jgi:hypothetical protein
MSGLGQVKFPCLKTAAENVPPIGERNQTRARLGDKGKNCRLTEESLS